jgi:hypothetical protein
MHETCCFSVAKPSWQCNPAILAIIAISESILPTSQFADFTFVPGLIFVATKSQFSANRGHAVVRS